LGREDLAAVNDLEQVLKVSGQDGQAKIASNYGVGRSLTFGQPCCNIFGTLKHAQLRLGESVMDKALDNFRVRFEYAERELELVNKLLDRHLVKAVIHVLERDRKELFAY